MLKYDLTDLGYKYKGAATTKSYDIEYMKWNITNIPIHIDRSTVESDFKHFIDRIYVFSVPTSYQCNLSCKYCYIEDPRMKNKDVSKERILKILENIKEMFPKAQSDNDKIHISFCCAEPFMNMDTLETVHEFGLENYKNRFEYDITTNGTIWSERVEKFLMSAKDMTKRIQISLDGPQHIQDINRPYRNGKGSFKDVENFTKNLILLYYDMNIDNVHHLASTVHLQNLNFAENWRDAAIFFSEPNTWHTTLPYLPMRMSGENMNDEEIKRFVNAQKMLLEVIKNRANEGVLALDFYTSNLFGNVSCKTPKCFPGCSSMNTEISIDIDGGMYPCHGALTRLTYKPWLWFGNLFDKTIDYSKFKRNLHYQFGIWNRAKCTDCQIYHYTSGSMNVCWTCAPRSLTAFNEPFIDSLTMCKAHNEGLPYWVEIAKMNITGNPILDEIDIPIKLSENTLNVEIDEDFDKYFDNIISTSIKKLYGKKIENNDCHYDDTWWKWDTYFDEVNKKGDVKDG
jgi:uncharacterized protein